MKKKSTQVTAEVTITKYESEEETFFSLTDMARYKNADNPSEVIRTWLANSGNV